MWANLGMAVGGALLGNRQRKKQEAQDAERALHTEMGERSRQGRIDATRARIGQIFEGPQRQRQVADYGTRLRALLGTELGRRKTDASRNLKFALARSGLIGSSVQRDKGARMGEEFAEAAVQNERRVQRGMNDLRATDERTRLALEQAAEGGLGMSDAIRRGQQTASSTLSGAQLDTITGGLGDVFADTAATYKTLNERAAQRKGFGYVANRQDLYGRAR